MRNSLIMPSDPNLSLDGRVRVEVVRGADTADFFSTLTTKDLQAILRSSQTLPIEDLVNTGAVRIDVPNQRIFRDIYWKGSFAADSVLGREERLRTENLHPEVHQHGKIFAGATEPCWLPARFDICFSFAQSRMMCSCVAKVSCIDEST